MPAAARRITPADLIPDADYARQRKDRRAALLPVKRLRRIELGPVCTVYFETYETMLFQVQEMLLTERGGADQIPDELAAYNPLIPQGSELVATVMFEMDDPIRREATLARLAAGGLFGGCERSGERAFCPRKSATAQCGAVARRVAVDRRELGHECWGTQN